MQSEPVMKTSSMSDRNGSTRKTTVYLDRESLDRVRAIRESYGISTQNKAIRKAIELATQPIRVDIHVLAEVIRWAQQRPFQTPREKAELHEITRSSYEVLKRHAVAAGILQSKPEQLPEALRSLLAATGRLPSNFGTGD